MSVVFIAYTQEQMESAVKIPQSVGQDQNVMTDEMPMMNFFATVFGLVVYVHLGMVS